MILKSCLALQKTNLRLTIKEAAFTSSGKRAGERQCSILWTFCTNVPLTNIKNGIERKLRLFSFGGGGAQVQILDERFEKARASLRTC